MASDGRREQNSDSSCGRAARNSFGVMDVPNPHDQEVLEFASKSALEGSENDANAEPWNTTRSGAEQASLDGAWSSRWNGGVVKTIPGDTKEKWKQGTAKIEAIEERVYILFDWDNGAGKGLVEAQRERGNHLVGRYINLGDPTITRPWIGLIISPQRIDGKFPEGRLDFRR
jgi:hypothetical protein